MNGGDQTAHLIRSPTTAQQTLKPTPCGEMTAWITIKPACASGFALVLRVGPLGFVFQHLPRHSVHSDLSPLFALLHVEGITQTTAAAFLFEFFLHDVAARIRLECDLA